LGLSFFGLTSNNNPNEVKLNIYRQIHQICFFGKGGYSWPVVYNMPVYLRRFIFSEIRQHYEEEKSAHEKASKQYSPSKSSPGQQTIPWNPSKSKSPAKYK